jgi:hypothetical protein
MMNLHQVASCVFTTVTLAFASSTGRVSRASVLLLMLFRWEGKARTWRRSSMASRSPVALAHRSNADAMPPTPAWRRDHQTPLRDPQAATKAARGKFGKSTEKKPFLDFNTRRCRWSNVTGKLGSFRRLMHRAAVKPRAA